MTLALPSAPLQCSGCLPSSCEHHINIFALVDFVRKKRKAVPLGVTQEKLIVNPSFPLAGAGGKDLVIFHADLRLLLQDRSSYDTCSDACLQFLGFSLGCKSSCHCMDTLRRLCCIVCTSNRSAENLLGIQHMLCSRLRPVLSILTVLVTTMHNRSAITHA